MLKLNQENLPRGTATSRKTPSSARVAEAFAKRLEELSGALLGLERRCVFDPELIAFKSLQEVAEGRLHLEKSEQETASFLLALCYERGRILPKKARLVEQYRGQSGQLLGERALWDALVGLKSPVESLGVLRLDKGAKATERDVSNFISFYSQDRLADFKHVRPLLNEVVAAYLERRPYGPPPSKLAVLKTMAGLVAGSLLEKVILQSVERSQTRLDKWSRVEETSEPVKRPIKRRNAK